MVVKDMNSLADDYGPLVSACWCKRLRVSVRLYRYGLELCCGDTGDTVAAYEDTRANMAGVFHLLIYTYTPTNKHKVFTRKQRRDAARLYAHLRKWQAAQNAITADCADDR